MTHVHDHTDGLLTTGGWRVQDDVSARDDPDHLGARAALTTPDAGPHRTLGHADAIAPGLVHPILPAPDDRPAPCHDRSVAPSAASVPVPSACSASERMSMRQVVSFAASRAFWPSLPIASESW